MTTDREDRKLVERLQELPREIPPLKDPWPEINQRIEALETSRQQKPAGRFGPAHFIGAIAASLMIAFTAGWLFGQRDIAPNAGALPEAGLAEQEAAPGVWSTLTSAVEAEYDAAFREFMPVGEARPDLPYQTVFELEKGWAILKATEDSLTEALEATPSDPFLVKRLMDLRARQLDFLRQLAELDQDKRRTSI